MIKVKGTSIQEDRKTGRIRVIQYHDEGAQTTRVKKIT